MATAYHNLSEYDFNSVPNAEAMKFGIVGFESSQKETEKKDEVQTSNVNDIIKKERILRLKKVSGGYDEDYMSQLDVPSFMRHQMD